MPRKSRRSNKRLGLSPIIDNESRPIRATKQGVHTRIRTPGTGAAQDLVRSLQGFTNTGQRVANQYDREKQEERLEETKRLAEQGELDGLTGNVDPELLKNSKEYFRSATVANAKSNYHTLRRELGEEYKELFDGDSSTAEVSKWLDTKLEENYTGLDDVEVARELIPLMQQTRNALLGSHQDFYEGTQKNKRITEVNTNLEGDFELNGAIDYKKYRDELKSLRFSDDESVGILYEGIRDIAIREGKPELLDNLPDDIKNHTKINGKIDTAIKQAGRTRKAQEDAYYDRVFQSAYTRAIAGGFESDADVHGLNLKPQHKLQLLSANNKVKEKQQARFDAINAYTESAESQGNIRLSPTTEGKKIAEEGYLFRKKQLENVDEPLLVKNDLILKEIASIGIIPKSFMSDVKRDLGSNNPETVAGALGNINQLLEQNKDFRKEFHKANPNGLIAARLLHNGATREEASAIYNQLEDRDAVTRDRNKATLTAYYQEGAGNPIRPHLESWSDETFEGANVPDSLRNDYIESFDTYFLAVGDVTKAHQLAQDDVQNLWSPSNISGESVLMRHAPEAQNYGMSSNDWIKDDFDNYTNSLGESKDSGTYSLISDQITDHATGEKTWGVSFVDNYGTIHFPRDTNGNLVRYRPDYRRAHKEQWDTLEAAQKATRELRTKVIEAQSRPSLPNKHKPRKPKRNR